MRTESLERKLLSMKDLPILRKKNKSIVMTNGGFSVIHYGHLYYLNDASKYGDILVVAVNTNESIRRLKGYDAPESDDTRFYHLASLGCVDYIIPFNDASPIDIMKVLKPDVYVKGGDYTIETINHEERCILEGLGVDIRFTDFKKGYSASEFVKKMRNISFKKDEVYI